MMGKVVVRGEEARALAVEVLRNGGTFEDAAKATGFGTNYCRQLANQAGLKFRTRIGEYESAVLRLVKSGYYANQIAKELSISITSVRKIAANNNIIIPRKSRKPVPSKFSVHEDYIRQAILSGKTYSDVARELGFNPSRTGDWCKRHGILLTEEGRAKGFHDGHGGRSYCKNARGKSIAERVKDNSVSFVYIGGYKNCDSMIEVECTVCKRRSIISYQTIRKTDCPARCKLCESDKVAERKAENDRVKAEREEQRRLRREEREAKEAALLEAKKHVCPVCGKITTRPKYCSDQCRNKVLWKNKDHRRRLKIQAAFVDDDISLEEVFRRDKGICHICGMACDWNDHAWKGNVFITGRLYPTIDHVVPLARGGEHSWENVRLAHLCCNSAKGARTA